MSKCPDVSVMHIATRRIDLFWSKVFDTFWSGGKGTVWHKKSQNRQYSQRFLNFLNFYLPT